MFWTIGNCRGDYFEIVDFSSKLWLLNFSARLLLKVSYLDRQSVHSNKKVIIYAPSVSLIAWESGNIAQPTILRTCEPGNTRKTTILRTWEPGNTGGNKNEFMTRIHGTNLWHEFMARIHDTNSWHEFMTRIHDTNLWHEIMTRSPNMSDLEPTCVWQTPNVVPWPECQPEYKSKLYLGRRLNTSYSANEFKHLGTDGGMGGRPHVLTVFRHYWQQFVIYLS